MKTHLIIIIALLLNCSTRHVNHTDVECNDIKEIMIYDKFSQPFTNRKTVFTDKAIVTNFCQEIKKLKPVTSVPVVKANFGFYELKVLYVSGDKDDIDIIYTKYDGVIIRFNGKYYKNNDLDSVMRGCLASDEWKG